MQNIVTLQPQTALIADWLPSASVRRQRRLFVVEVARKLECLDLIPN